jgi:hypothetical protein
MRTEKSKQYVPPLYINATGTFPLNKAITAQHTNCETKIGQMLCMLLPCELKFNHSVHIKMAPQVSLSLEILAVSL